VSLPITNVSETLKRTDSGTAAAPTTVQPEEGEEVVEVPVCWSCGGTPCDWKRFPPDTLDHINKWFPASQDGSRVHSKTHVQVNNKTIRYTLHRTFYLSEIWLPWDG
jgi:hypothetical protein